MVFSDSITYQGIINDIDFLLYGTSAVFNTDYALADRVRNVNITWDEAIAILFKADPNHKWDDTTNADLPIATLPLTANLDHYDLLDSALVIHRVRMKDENGEMTTLEACLRSELDDDELNSTGSPKKYYKIGGVVFPVPVPDYGATGGVEVEFQRGANHFTAADTTKSPGFASQFHQFLSVGAALRFAIANGMKDKIAQLRADKEAIKKDMMEHYERRSPDERPKLKFKKSTINHFGL